MIKRGTSFLLAGILSVLTLSAMPVQAADTYE